ncbi:amidohydrolase family protein [Gaopeijia maritima]|uniref:amidohydrolase family protein n=1 Tax=Gaopeijia maritima TaxID=3119007 RepID=UPI003245BE3A
MFRHLSLLLLACGLAAPAAPQSLALRNATVVDVTDGTLLPGRTVLIDGPRIAAIGPADALPVPPGTTVVEAEGAFVIPGLWDMHVHTFNNNSLQPPNTWTLPLYLANGVTGVRDMWVKPGAQAEQVRAWQQELDAGSFVGPRFGAIGTLVDGPPPIQKSDTVSTAAEAAAFVATLAEGGIDFVKSYSRLSPEAYHGLVAAARAAGIEVAGHGPNSLSTFEVAEAGQRSIEHLTGVHETCSSQEQALRAEGVQAFDEPGRVVSTFDPAKCASLYARLAEREVWQVPTLITNRVWTADARIEDLLLDEGRLYTPTWEAAEWGWVESFLAWTPPDDRAAYEALYRLEQRIVGEMHAAGVPILAGTDFGNPYIYPGFSLLDELGELVESGLSPLAALQAATLDPARYLDRTDDLGTVSEGRLADLVLLDANPLDDIEHVRQIRAVVMNGRLFTSDDLARMKQEVLVGHYREALAQPAPLGVQPLDEAAAERLVGAYRDVDTGNEAEVVLDGGELRATFGDWVDALEPLGGSLFRVTGTNVVYLFQPEPEGPARGFEINDGDTVMVFERIR